MTTGQVYSEISSEFNADGFLNYLKILVPKIPEGKKFLVVLDNARPHHAKKVTAYVDENCPNMELFFLPPYSPDMNPAENVWKLLRKKATHNVYFNDMEILHTTIKNTLDEFSLPSTDRRNYCAVI